MFNLLLFNHFTTKGGNRRKKKFPKRKQDFQALWFCSCGLPFGTKSHSQLIVALEPEAP